VGIEHNKLAHAAAQLLLAQLRHGNASWATNRLTPHSTYWNRMAAWPRPDAAFEDVSTQSSLAIEFKPPGQPRREYVTGFGQAVTYLQSFEYAALVVPDLAPDGFQIAEYLKDCLVQNHAQTVPMGLFAYKKDPGDSTDLRPLVNLRPRTGPAPAVPRNIGRTVFWSYWRDLSNYDLITILTLLDRGNRTFPQAFYLFWNRFMVTGRAETWEGRSRKPQKNNARNFNSQRLNTRLSLQHIGLIGADDRLTDDGFHLLRLGKIYGADSKAFLGTLAALVLDGGKHIELIFWVDEQQRLISRSAKREPLRFYRALDRGLVREGVIRRAPSGKRGKLTFLRDEQKLWNKLGLLVRDGSRYFQPGQGLVFDWRAIVSAVGE
jgi:hypothetical protein